MKRSLWLLVTAAVIAGDQLTKQIVVAHLSGGRTIPIIGSFAKLDLVHNRGIGFGIPVPWMIPISILAIVFIIVLAILLERDRGLGRAGTIGMAMVLGAGLGNFIDRARFGYVTDFVEVWKWPTFNAADTCLVIGIGILLISYWRRPTGKKTSVSNDS